MSSDTTHSAILNKAQTLIKSGNPEYVKVGRQLLFTILPPSYFVENYLQDRGALQKLDGFPMLRYIYDHIPQRMLLKCSRKTLKSTLLSNIICYNMIRWNYYAMLYVGPQEFTAKYFSANYLSARFDSENVTKLLHKGWIKNDIFEKILRDTKSSVLIRYCNDDATRIRSAATDQNIFDETQDIALDQLPIINETMSASKFKRHTYAGTPLTTDNTLNALWLTTNQLEWFFKCRAAGCGHWNALIEGNKPLEMISPTGLVCSKCKALINSADGEWVATCPEVKNFTGFHLAQPILPHYNSTLKEWSEVYAKCTSNGYSVAQIYNEVFGLAYDEGTKPISEAELRTLCTLGSMFGPDKELRILNAHRHRYINYSCGVDWGVSNVTSRTVAILGGFRDDGVFEVYWAHRFNHFDFDAQIAEIARQVKRVNALAWVDSGPDPIRGIRLIEQIGPHKGQMVRYEHGKFIQRYDSPTGAYDWKQNRSVLHRSDVISLALRMLKGKRILFPCWEEMSSHMQDILAEYIEVKDGLYNQELFYRHKPSQPDDFLHALVYALTCSLMQAGDSCLQGPSSSSAEFRE